MQLLCVPVLLVVLYNLLLGHESVFDYTVGTQLPHGNKKKDIVNHFLINEQDTIDYHITFYKHKGTLFMSIHSLLQL